MTKKNKTYMESKNKIIIFNEESQLIISFYLPRQSLTEDSITQFFLLFNAILYLSLL